MAFIKPVGGGKCPTSAIWKGKVRPFTILHIGDQPASPEPAGSVSQCEIHINKGNGIHHLKAGLGKQEIKHDLDIIFPDILPEALTLHLRKSQEQTGKAPHKTVCNIKKIRI